MQRHIMKGTFLIALIISSANLFCQTITEKLTDALNKLQADEQFKHAAIGMYVVDEKNGSVIVDRNAELGLAPASCQKIVTSAAAFSLLGNNYTFKTTIGYWGDLKDSILTGDLYITGYGDPTFGSFRWSNTKEEMILTNCVNAIIKKGIKNIAGNIFCFDRNFESNNTPGGWPWEDIGNYYGAGASAFNWRENQYDIILKSGDKIGTDVQIKSLSPSLFNVNLYSEVKASAKGSGDNAYIYLPPYADYGFIRGTIPVNEESFTISGAMPNAANQFALTLADRLRKKGFNGIIYAGSYNNNSVVKKDVSPTPSNFFTFQSPSLDSINYWFLKKSINLYGEALVKTIAFEKEKFGSTDKGIDIIQSFWTKNGIDATALNIKDGSGLSPANRVTTKALVQVLQFAKKQNWFASFYNALPEMNGIKMKDGYISDVRSYTGYVNSKSGANYVFSFIVNNFNGSASTAKDKIWKLLDLLK